MNIEQSDNFCITSEKVSTIFNLVTINVSGLSFVFITPNQNLVQILLPQTPIAEIDASSVCKGRALKNATFFHDAGIQ